MRPTTKDPLNAWYRSHQELRGTETWRLTKILAIAHSINGFAIRIEESWEAWYNDRSNPVPDLVECIGHYGYSRLLIQHWKQFPIEIPADQADAWREWGFGASLFEFRERQASVAGGFLELAVKDPALTVQLIEAQLQQKFAELTRLIHLPIEDYTPQFTEDALTARFKAEGYSEREVRERVETEMAEDGVHEPSYIGRPFHRYEQLLCFEWGMEKLRIFSATENAPELGLPSMELYNALLQIDLNTVIRQFEAAEPQLRRILQHLARLNYFELDNDTAPERFWWRHWKREVEKQRAQRQERSGHKSHRPRHGKN